MFVDTDTKPWPGQHEINVRIVNRDAADFHGTLHVTSSQHASDVSVLVPKHSTSKFSAPVQLSTPGAHHYSVALLDSAGKHQRDTEVKFHISEPLTVFPACPCYLSIGSRASTVRVDARVVVNPSQRAGSKLETTLRNSAGAKMTQTSVDASRGEYVGTTLHVPTTAQAVYSISVRLLARDGSEIANGETDVRTCPTADSIVKTQPNGFLNVAGQREFPIGMYSCSHYDEMASADFNATHSYSITIGDASDPINSTDIDVKRLLDQNVKYHLRMMVELPRHAIEKGEWAQVRQRIETFRYHPGLLCWGSEERVARGETKLKNMKHFTNWCINSTRTIRWFSATHVTSFNI